MICEDLLKFIDRSPTPFHAVANAAAELESLGYERLSESGRWDLAEGGKYFVTRNLSSIIAFRVPKRDFSGFMITASHCDSPAYKIKENSQLGDKNYVRLSTEGYGGMICSTWLDRPLSVAGRVMVKSPSGIEARLVDLEDMSVVIPNVAIHFNRNVNDGVKLNQAVDMIPLYGLAGKDASLRERIAEKLGIREDDIVTTDLTIYNCEKGIHWNSFISAPRLDDLECAYAALEAFEGAGKSESIPVYCCFDNEEVGSGTKQGAASTFLYDVLTRLSLALGKGEDGYHMAVANSFLLSCDNAHALHPNHPELHDANHRSFMNGGIVIKYNASQKYTSDSVSAGLFQMICDRAGVPFQRYANRADMAGGSTLGNISNTQVSLNAVDIGLPQLAMHSAYETAGDADPEYMVKALSVFYGSSLKMKSDGVFEIE